LIKAADSSYAPVELRGIQPEARDETRNPSLSTQLLLLYTRHAREASRQPDEGTQPGMPESCVISYWLAGAMSIVGFFQNGVLAALEDWATKSAGKSRTTFALGVSPREEVE